VKRRTRRKIVLLALLSLLLVLLGLWFWNYWLTGNAAIPDLRVAASDTLDAPNFMFAFAGSGSNTLVNPVGVFAYKGEVFVADSSQALIFVFRQSDGAFLRSFGKDHLTAPIYLAVNPKDGDLYVTDRRQRSVEVFTTAGTWVKRFDPNLPKAELPAGFNTHGDQWAPVAIGFEPDGTMLVTEILNGHRFLIFGPDGTFLKSAGTFGVANTALDLPGEFQYPNSIKYNGGLIYVMDSNNRRVQIYTNAGVYKGLIPMTGLPRGFAFLPTDLTAAGASGKPKYVAIDTLAHNGTIWDTSGAELLTFGVQGVSDGAFNYPDDVTVGDRDVMFISDTINKRVQAWGWQRVLSPIPHILPRQPLWLLGLPLLLLLLLPFRKRKKYATADFVQAVFAAGEISLMRQRRVRWLVSEADYAKLQGLEQNGIKLSELLEGVPYSESDAAELAVRYKLGDAEAAVLAFAQRAKVIHTDDPDLMRLAKLLEVDTIDAGTFIADATKEATK
jgi:DNA-binding beta-propeller fold protein YncE/predicted nucleic acid-binding protein